MPGQTPRQFGSAVRCWDSRWEMETACCRANARPAEVNITMTVELSNDLINRSTVGSDAFV